MNNTRTQHRYSGYERLNDADQFIFDYLKQNLEGEPTLADELTQTLQRGSKGNFVRELQAMLNAAQFNAGAVDGDFGAKTESAVKSFQKSRGMVQTGVVDAKTWAALQMASPYTPPPQQQEQSQNEKPEIPPPPGTNGSAGKVLLCLVTGAVAGVAYNKKAKKSKGGKVFGKKLNGKAMRSLKTAGVGLGAAVGTLLVVNTITEGA